MQKIEDQGYHRLTGKYTAILNNSSVFSMYFVQAFLSPTFPKAKINVDKEEISDRWQNERDLITNGSF